jgi:tape measure domain-containing protein
MANTYNISVRLSSAGAVTSGNQVTSTLQQMGRAAGQTQSQLSSLEGMLRRVFSVYAAYNVTSSILRQANAYQELQNKLRVVVDDQVKLGVVNEELFAIAQRTRAGLEETGQLYARLSFNTQELGLSQREVLRMTETLNNVLLISGATTAEASAAMTQFTQAMAKGRLDGDELKTILETMPPLARAIAQSMGVTVGELRKMGAEGKLAGRDLVVALQRFDDEARDRAGRTIPTLAQGWTLFSNSLLDSVGRIDQVTGTTRALAAVLTALADVFKRLTDSFVDFNDRNRQHFFEILRVIDGYDIWIDLLTRLHSLLSKLPGMDIGAASSVKETLDYVAILRAGAFQELAQAGAKLNADRIAREKAAAGLDAPGKAVPPPPGKDQERYAELLRRANAEIDRQNELLLVSEDRREVLSKILDIEEKFQRNKTPITDSDRTALEARLVTLQAMTRAMRTVEDATKAVFKGMEDSVVSFVETGKFEFKKFADQVVSDLVRIALQAYVTRPLVGAAVGGFGSLLGGSTAFSQQASTATGGWATTATASWLPKFASGGSFQVGGSGGTDSRLVAFMATPGESVRVDPPGKGGGDVQVIVNNNAAGTEATARETTQGGIRVVEVIVQAVSKGISDGSFDRAMGGRYGARPMTKRR